MEDLTLYNEVVLEAYALVDLTDSIFRVSRNYTVNEGAVYSASLFKPGLEVFSEVPEVDILIDTFLEFLSVEEDKLAREDDESLCHVTAEMLISAVKKLCKLARV